MEGGKPPLWGGAVVQDFAKVQICSRHHIEPPSDEGRRQSRHKVPSALFTVAFSLENDGRRIRNKKANPVTKIYSIFAHSPPCAASGASLLSEEGVERDAAFMRWFEILRKFKSVRGTI